MNYCKQIRIITNGTATWVEYEQKTTTSVIKTNGMPEAIQMASALQSNVDKWVEQ